MWILISTWLPPSCDQWSELTDDGGCGASLPFAAPAMVRFILRLWTLPHKLTSRTSILFPETQTRCASLVCELSSVCEKHIWQYYVCVQNKTECFHCTTVLHQKVIMMRVASVAVVQNAEPTLMQALMSRGRRTHEHSSNVAFIAGATVRSRLTAEAVQWHNNEVWPSPFLFSCCGIIKLV